MGSKKILLINAGYRPMGDLNIPLGLLFLAKPLIENGYLPLLIDTRVDDYKSINFDQFLCIGISTMSGRMLASAIEIAKYIRSKNPQIPLIWGGPHPTLEPMQTIKSKYVDVIVPGEGEKPLLEIVKALDLKKPLDGVRGIIFKNQGEIICTPQEEVQQFNKLNNLPYELLDMGKYPNIVDKFEYHSSRGCPHRCTFCSSVSTSKRTWRAKPAQVVIEELQYIMDRFHPKRFVFLDSQFFVDKKRVEEICKNIIAKGWNIRINTYCRCDIFSSYDDNFIALIRKAGINEIALGGESGSQRVLDFIKKDILVEQIIRSVELCRQNNITSVLSFIIGIPTETEAELEETLKLYDRLMMVNPGTAVNGLFIFVPFPGAPLTEYVKEHCHYHPPNTLVEWSNWQFGETRSITWLSKARIRKVKGISLLTRYFFIWHLLTHWTYEQKLVRHGSSIKVLASTAFNAIFYIPAKLRWSLRLFSFPVEFFFWESMLRRFKGNG